MRYNTIWGLTFAVAFMLAALLPARAAPTVKPVTVAMSLTPLSAPFIIAHEKGYFRKNGLDVKVKDFIGGHRTIKALFEGKADIATSSEAVVMFNSFKRSDFTMVCTFVSSDNDVKIVTRKNTNIRRVKDLAGRRIGTVLGSSAQFFLDETLALNGVDRTTIKVSHLNPESAPAALKQGDVDAIVVWEPISHLALTGLGKDGFEVPHDRAYIETFNAIVMRDYAKKNPDVLKRMIRSLIKATEYIKAHRQETQRIVASRLGKDLALIAAIWKDFSFEISLHQWLLSTLDAQARWASQLNLVPDTIQPNYLDFLFIPPLKQVSPSSVTVF